MKPAAKQTLIALASLAVLAAIAIASAVMGGVYNFAADVPHFPAVHALIEYARERSVDERAEDIQVPDLSNSAWIVQGAGNYEAMCAQCHLAPGVSSSELSRGLYPAPPNLAQERPDPARAFWVIKHGVKASGMPAWGKSMTDQDIWIMVAFLNTLSTLDAAKYRDTVARSGGHSHGAGAREPAKAGTGEHEHIDEHSGMPDHHSNRKAPL